MRFNLIYLLAAAVFAYEVCRRFYRQKNVDRLERDSKITPDVAARIRRQPKWLLWLGILATIGFFVKALFKF